MCSVNMHCMLLVSKWNFTTKHSQTGTVSTFIITHIWKDWWERRVHTCFLFYLKRDIPFHHIFNFSFNSFTFNSFCIRLNSGEFLLPILCVETLKLCSSWKWIISGNTDLILLHLQTPLFLDLTSYFSNSSCLGSHVQFPARENIC